MTLFAPPKKPIVEFVVKHKRVGNQIVPAGWTMLRFDASDDRRVTRRWKLKMESFKKGAELGKEAFRVDVPEGTIVTDTAAGRAYAIKADGTPGRDYRSIARREQVNKLERRQRQWSRPWVTAFVLGAMIVATATIVWFRKNP